MGRSLEDAEIEIEILKEQLTETLDVLSDMVEQACLVKTLEKYNYYGSFALTAYSNAMLLLSKYGRFEIDAVEGRRIMGKLIKPNK